VDADEASLNVTRIRTSSFDEEGIALELAIAPHRLKMAATSSAVVPPTNPDTSTTLPCPAEPAPFIESCC